MKFSGFMLVLVALAAATIAATAEAIPLPRQKPPRELVSPAMSIPIPRPNPRRSAPAEAPPDSAGKMQAPSRPASDAGACAARLKGLDIVYSPQKAIGDGGGCGAPDPLEVTEIAGVTLTPPAIINCTMARELHGWIEGTLQPAAKRRLKTEVTAIHVAASYVCRRRNNAIGGKLSEHAKANALDMSGFTFAKSDAVSVGGGSWGGGILKAMGLSKGGTFLDDIRKGACTHFTTVLGPGSDRHHGDHFHVDAIARKGGYRICK